MPDALVQTALSHWGPRFLYRGVDHNDLLRTAAAIERWEDWLDAWSALGDRHRELARRAEDRGRTLSASEAWTRAALAYHFARYLWLLDEERYRTTCERSVAALRRAHRLADPTFERLEIPFQDGVMVANLRRPAGAERPPLVVLVPGLDSTKEEFPTWEATFLRRGMATLALDGPGQGEGGYTLRICPQYERPVAAVLDHLAGRGDVDLGRAGIAGVSLGGYYAPRALAAEPRLRAGIGIGGWYELTDSSWRRTPSITRRKLRYHTGTASDAEAAAYMRAATLAGLLAGCHRPLLLINGDEDRLAPPSEYRRIAAEAPMAELLLVPGGNHCATDHPHEHTAYAGDWMREQLGGQRGK